MKHPACYAARRVSIPISLCDHYLQAHGFVRYLGRFCVVERRDFVLFKRGIFWLFVSLFAALASKRWFTSFWCKRYFQKPVEVNGVVWTRTLLCWFLARASKDLNFGSHFNLFYESKACCLLMILKSTVMTRIIPARFEFLKGNVEEKSILFLCLSGLLHDSFMM